MAAKPETNFIKSVNNHLKETYFEKTNNPFRSGIADSWYSGLLGDLWVEYKYEPNLPKIKDYMLNLSPRQLKWLSERYEEGRNVAVILGLPEGGIIYVDRSWESATDPRVLRAGAVPRPKVAEWIYGQVGMSPCKSSSRRLPAQP